MQTKPPASRPAGAREKDPVKTSKKRPPCVPHTTPKRSAEHTRTTPGRPPEDPGKTPRTSPDNPRVTPAESASVVCAAVHIKSCDTKAKGLLKKKAGKPIKPMGQEHYGAILLYTANAIYQALNKALREEDRTKVKAFFTYLRLLFDACDRLPTKKRTLWRGIGVDLFPQYKVGVAPLHGEASPAAPRRRKWRRTSWPVAATARRS